MSKHTVATTKAPVTERALVQRINRALALRGERLRAGRGRSVDDLGDYFVVDVDRRAVVGKDITLEEYGRDLGVLQPWERVR